MIAGGSSLSRDFGAKMEFLTLLLLNLNKIFCCLEDFDGLYCRSYLRLETGTTLLGCGGSACGFSVCGARQLSRMATC
jgi:hypothetical protein